MRPPIIDKLSEPERILLREAWKEYPGALRFTHESDARIEAVAVGLVDQGYFERVEHDAAREPRRGKHGVSYRVTAYWAGRLKAVADRLGWES